MVDRPQVVAEAQEFWRTNPTAGSERLSFMAGDLREQVPAAQNAQDIFLLSAVLHALDDKDALAVLRQVAKACGTSGASIAVLDMVLPEQNPDATWVSFDMQMLVGSHGRERTDSEWLQLFEQSGLVRTELVQLQSFASIQVLKVAAN